jgi:beta-barrel assembly-enhancing protease
MRFSRGLEKDADLNGLEILRNNKINQNGMVGLMKKLKKEEDDAGLEDIPAYLSTHPLGKERIKYINAAISNNDSSRNEIFYPLWNEF